MKTLFRGSGTSQAAAVVSAVTVRRTFGYSFATWRFHLRGEAIRSAVNGLDLCVAVREASTLTVQILSAQEEARLAFIGAARTLKKAPAGALAVVDVGGGSSELIVGRVPNVVDWSRSVAVGSGDLADAFLHSDPPTPSELGRARQHIDQAFRGIEVPNTSLAVAVGGSATSLRRLAGALLDDAVFSRTLELLCNAAGDEVARRFGLDRERVRLLPGGLLILQAAAERFGANLQIGYGGLREGALLEAAG